MFFIDMDCDRICFLLYFFLKQSMIIFDANYIYLIFLF